MKVKDKILNYLYPPRCPVCHGIVEPGCRYICPGCAEKLPLVRGKTCIKCGKPLEEWDGEHCFDCEKEPHIFSKGMGVFAYDEVMGSSLHKFKYQGRREYGKFYAACVWRYGKSILKTWNPQVIIPVPIHRSRYLDRGYNQAEVIGGHLSKLMKIPMETGCVLRREKTKAQKDLTPQERRENLEHAFVPGKKAAFWRRILLVDDIYTTGSTMDAVSKILKQTGAGEIYAVSICIGKGFMVK